MTDTLFAAPAADDVPTTDGAPRPVAYSPTPADSPTAGASPIAGTPAIAVSSAVPADLLTDSADIASVVVDLMRQLHSIKARLAVGPEADHSPLFLLVKLVRSGPCRARALAELVGADPSTVSRQVASLVKSGLVRRDADPDDGRACLLVPTDLGRRRVEEYARRRAEVMAPLVGDWSPQDRSDFLRLLRKYVASVDAHRDDVIATLIAHPQKGH